MFNYIQIGTILKPTKREGELIASLQNDYLYDADEIKAIFIEFNGNIVPFFIETLELDDSLAYIKFEEFNGPEDVKPYNGNNLYIREQDIKDYSPEEKTDFTGFQIIDETTKNKLEIIELEEFPGQLMAKVTYNNKSILLPLIEEFIIEIDFDKKTINMNLPEGILDL
ncbi:MAG: hypothetical protein R2771_04910 [Saprospiraceae bacterium]